ELDARIREHGQHRRGHAGGEQARDPTRAVGAEELRGREGEVGAMARGHEPAHEREPERDLLQVGGGARDVEAQRAADRLRQREQRGQGEGDDEHPSVGPDASVRPVRSPAHADAAARGPSAVRSIPTTNTVIAPTTLYQRKCTDVYVATSHTVAIPASSPQNAPAALAPR